MYYRQAPLGIVADSPVHQFTHLASGPIRWFSDWPAGDVPRSGAVVYTIWNREGSFIYVGMSGRSFTGGSDGTGGAGPWGRLNSHAAGRRSGDQFCVYVADRLVLPTLHKRIAEIADGSLSLDEPLATTSGRTLGSGGLQWRAGRLPLSLNGSCRRERHRVGSRC
jgi:hypothetical protein